MTLLGQSYKKAIGRRDDLAIRLKLEPSVKGTEIVVKLIVSYYLI